MQLFRASAILNAAAQKYSVISESGKWRLNDPLFSELRLLTDEPFKTVKLDFKLQHKSLGFSLSGSGSKNVSYWNEGVV